jgi:hypothetical protein
MNFLYKVSDINGNEDNWIFLFLTNAKAKDALNIKGKKNSALVSRKQFKEFYGYTHASRAQFASSMFIDLKSLFDSAVLTHMYLCSR